MKLIRQEMPRKEAQRVITENILRVLLVEAAVLKRLAKTHHGLHTHQRKILKSCDRRRRQQVGIQPRETVAHGEAFAAQLTHHVIRTEEHAAWPERLEGGAHGARFRDGGSVHHHIFERLDLAQRSACIAVVE